MPEVPIKLTWGDVEFTREETLIVMEAARMCLGTMPQKLGCHLDLSDECLDEVDKKLNKLLYPDGQE